MPTGEDQAWEILSQLDPKDVCRRALVTFDELSDAYALKSFHQDIFICPKDKKMFGHSPSSDFLLNRLGRYSRLSILWYLICAKDLPLSGKLIRPADVAGG